MQNSGLILTRKVGESIIIGDDIKITVIIIKGGQVGLRTDAPRNVSVHREEIWLKSKGLPPNPVPDYRAEMDEIGNH